jgi:ABC-type multidrug transport system ATPase subunit
MALLEISKVSIRFGGLTALCDFDFSLDQGELVGLIGPNGAGRPAAGADQPCRDRAHVSEHPVVREPERFR